MFEDTHLTHHARTHKRLLTLMRLLAITHRVLMTRLSVSPCKTQDALERVKLKFLAVCCSNCKLGRRKCVNRTSLISNVFL